MTCSHDLDPEYIYPGDFDILDVFEENKTLHITLALPCPDCGQSLKLDTGVESVEETALELPLDDERYD